MHEYVACLLAVTRGMRNGGSLNIAQIANV